MEIRRLHNFLIIERLEAGGMGEIFLGRDERTGTLAAIKTLSQRLSREEIYVRRFQREARLYRNLAHPNIVRCLESGFDNDRYFIAMEFIKGRSLARILEVYGKLEVEQALCVVAQLSEALQFAHRRYVIHRDIKPRNIMVSTGGVVKLLDFGIAHADDHLIQTDLGQMVGTFYYASPEQVLGRKVTVKSDIYCTGLLLYEMLSGRRALGSGGDEDLDPLDAYEKIIPLDEIRPDLDPDLVSAVGNMLSFDSAHRTPSAERVLRELGSPDKNPGILQPLVKVFGDISSTRSRTLQTLATTVTSFLRRSLFRTKTQRLLFGAGVLLWLVLSCVFYTIINRQGLGW